LLAYFRRQRERETYHTSPSFDPNNTICIMLGLDTLKVKMKIRNPKLVLEEIERLSKLGDKNILSDLIHNSVFQFWRWLTLETDITLSECENLCMAFTDLIQKYPHEGTVEFFTQKIMDLAKKDMKEFDSLDKKLGDLDETKMPKA
jgi:hypothetical protein